MVRAHSSLTRCGEIGIGLVVLSVALATSGCGAAPGTGDAPKGSQQADAPQPWDNLTGSAREDALVAAAKKETMTSASPGEQSFTPMYSPIF
jgi:Flp pilus assembly protein TadD